MERNLRREQDFKALFEDMLSLHVCSTHKPSIEKDVIFVLCKVKGTKVLCLKVPTSGHSGEPVVAESLAQEESSDEPPAKRARMEVISAANVPEQGLKLLKNLDRLAPFRRFSFRVRVIKKGYQGEATDLVWEGTNKKSCWVTDGSGGEAIMFHWLDDQCSQFGPKMIREDQEIYVEDARVYFFAGSNVSKYQIQLDERSKLREIV